MTTWEMEIPDHTNTYISGRDQVGWDSEGSVIKD